MIKTTNHTEIYNSRVSEMPKEIAEKEGFEVGSKVVLTFENGVIKSQIIPPVSVETKNEAARLIKKYDRTFRKLKDHGD